MGTRSLASDPKRIKELSRTIAKEPDRLPPLPVLLATPARPRWKPRWKVTLVVAVLLILLGIADLVTAGHTFQSVQGGYFVVWGLFQLYAARVQRRRASEGPSHGL